MTAIGSPAAIHVAGLRKSYGEHVVLDGIDLDVAEGHRLRAPRAERRRQDDHGPDPLDAASPPMAARSQVAGHDIVREPDAVRAAHRRHGPVLGGRRALHRRGEPAADGGPAPPRQGRGPPAGRRAARAVRPRRGGQEARHDLLRRHAAASRPGHDPRRRSADHLPRRADGRPRSAQPAGHVADRSRTSSPAA